MIVKLEEVDGELVLPIPDAILQQLEWGIGDTLDWGICPDGTFILRKTDLTE